MRRPWTATGPATIRRIHANLFERRHAASDQLQPLPHAEKTLDLFGGPNVPPGSVSESAFRLPSFPGDSGRRAVRTLPGPGLRCCKAALPRIVPLELQHTRRAGPAAGVDIAVA